MALGLGLGPAGERFGGGIQRAHLALDVGDDNGVGHGAQDGREPGFALGELARHGVFVDGDFDGRVERGGGDGLDDVAVRLGELGAIERGAIGVRGEEDDGDGKAAADDFGGLDAVHASVEADVHEHKLGVGRGFHGLLAGGDGGDDAVAELLDTLRDVARDQALVFNQQYGVGVWVRFGLHGLHDSLDAFLPEWGM